NLFRRGSRVSLAELSAFEKMASMELRSHSGICSNFRNRLQLHRSSSRSRLDLCSLTLGKRRAAADLLLGAALVSACARPHLFDRIPVALGASGWTDWQRRDVAPESVPAGRSRTTWARRVRSVADTLLVQLEQRVSSFPLRRRRCSFVAFNFRDRAGAFTRRAFFVLPVAHRCRTNLPQFSMGRSPARDRLSSHLFCALATLAKGAFVVAGIDDPGYSRAGFARGFVFAQVSSVQTHADVRRSEAYQRRRLMGLGESLVSLERAHGT